MCFAHRQKFGCTIWSFICSYQYVTAPPGEGPITPSRPNIPAITPSIVIFRLSCIFGFWEFKLLVKFIFYHRELISSLSPCFFQNSWGWGQGEDPRDFENLEKSLGNLQKNKQNLKQILKIFKHIEVLEITEIFEITSNI